MTNQESIREEGVNVLLNQLLRGHGLSAKAERRRRNAIPDLQVTLKTGDLALLECKWGDSHAALETQLDERLRQYPNAMAVVGVLYPENLKYAEDTQGRIGNGGFAMVDTWVTRPASALIHACVQELLERL